MNETTKPEIKFRSDVDPMLIDPTTGLRKLPRGYFFRFSINKHGSLIVSLRRKRLFGSKELNWDISFYEDGKFFRSPQHRMRFMSNEVVDQCCSTELRIAMNPRYVDDLEKLVGDYPPKKLA